MRKSVFLLKLGEARILVAAPELRIIIKRRIDRIRFLRWILTRFRASQLKRNNKKVMRAYWLRACKTGTAYSEEGAKRQMLKRIKATKKNTEYNISNNLVIVWVGANKEQDCGGFLQALQRYGKVVCFTREDGEYGQEFPIYGVYDKGVLERNSRRLRDIVSATVAEHGKVDVVFGQMWANYIDVKTLNDIREEGIPVVNVAMDDRLPEMWKECRNRPNGSVGLAKGVDLVLTTCSDVLIRYAVLGVPAVFWPLASDPEVFRPGDVRDIDVSFVGNKYGIRQELVDYLESRGIAVHAYGGGWERGPVEAEKVSEIFGRSKIVLGVGTVGHTRDVYTLKLRDFDATMSGALYVTHRNPDLTSLFTEGKEIECFTSFDEAERKVRYYLEHPDEAAAIGEAAAARARKEHSWNRRLDKVFSMLGLIRPLPNQMDK